MHISFYLLVPLISLSIMLVTPNLNFHSYAIAMVDGYAEGNGLYNNYENAASPPPAEGNGLYNNYENAAASHHHQKEMVSITTMKMLRPPHHHQKEMVSITTMKMLPHHQKEMVSITTMRMVESIQNIQSTQTNLKGFTMTN